MSTNGPNVHYGDDAKTRFERIQLTIHHYWNCISLFFNCFNSVIQSQYLSTFKQSSSSNIQTFKWSVLA